MTARASLALASLGLLSALGLAGPGCGANISDPGGSGGDGGHVNCDAAPTCSADEDQVQGCERADDSCRTVSVCGRTIFCEAKGNCEVAPVCNPGDESVHSCPDDAKCYTNSVCGSSIFCAHTCAELTCKSGDAKAPAGDCSSDVCYDVANDCKQSITCVRCPSEEPANGDDCSDFPLNAVCSYTACDVFTCTTQGDVPKVWLYPGGCGGEGPGSDGATP